MKQSFTHGIFTVFTCISICAAAQERKMIEKLPALNTSETQQIENKLPAAVKKEAATRKAKGYNVLLLQGTNKTAKLNAGRYLAQKVNGVAWRIDMSRLVSKYIGETEKNLNIVFDSAKSQNVVLFFDEGDALFGKRDTVQSSADRYDNQATNHFFRLVEKHRPSVIISIKAKNTISPAILEKYVLIAVD